MFFFLVFILFVMCLGKSSITKHVIHLVTLLLPLPPHSPSFKTCITVRIVIPHFHKERILALIAIQNSLDHCHPNEIHMSHIYNLKKCLLSTLKSSMKEVK